MRLEMVFDKKKLCRVSNDNGEFIDWDMSVFHRTSGSEAEDIFKDVNGFLSSLNAERREEIWKAYVDIDKAMMSITNHVELTNTVAGHVQRIYSQFDLEEIDNWMTNYREVIYPSTVLSPTEIRGLPAKHGMLRGSEFEQYPNDAVIRLSEESEDPNEAIYTLRISTDTTRPSDGGKENLVYALTPWVTGRTYLKTDYYGMVILAAALRLMVPIWSMYFKSTFSVFGNDMKEYRGIDLLKETYLLDSLPVRRLEQFIESFLATGHDLTGAILSALSRDQVPEWMLAMALVRRVGLGEYEGPDDKANIIAGVYRFIHNQFNGIDKRFMMVYERTPPTSDGDREERSLAERIRAKQREPVTEEVSIEWFLERENGLAAIRKYDSSVPQSLASECIENIKRIHHSTIVEEQFAIMRCVLKEHINVIIVDNLDKVQLARGLGITQALLWHWGFVHLAVMCSCTAIPPSLDMARITDVRSTVSEELLAQFVEYYPMAIGPEPISHRKHNPTYRATLDHANNCRKWIWYPHLPAKLEAELKDAVEPDGSFMLPMDLHEQLVELAIHVERMGAQ